jgi:CheY-like chemotaxis protein
MREPAEHHVLIVDDQVAARELTAFALETTGRYAVMRSSNATDALVYMDNRDFDCLVLDLDMPDMSGVDLLKLLRRREGRVTPPVIMVIPEGMRPGDAELAEVHVDGYVTKPFEPWDLCTLLDSMTGAITEASHLLSVDAVLGGFPYPTMVLDADHRVLLANSPFYQGTGTGIGDRYVHCSDELHEGGVVPEHCPLDAAVRSGSAQERTIETILGTMRVSVYPLSVTGPDGRALYLHVTQPMDAVKTPIPMAEELQQYVP